jgi:hypothetical protein
MSFPYKGSDSKGIVNYSLALKQNVVVFNVSSTYSIYSVDALCGNIEKSDHWCSKGGIGNWLLVTFNGIKPKITHVYIKSHPYTEYFLKSWKLEGSNDNSSWTELFSIYESSDLDRWNEKVYRVNNPNKLPFSFYKFTNTGPNNNDASMRITKVDFYGTLFLIPDACTSYRFERKSTLHLLIASITCIKYDFD